MYPLREVLFLVVCATICSCDDYEDIVDWGEARLDFLRGYLDFHWGVPCADWLRTLMNRVDPDLFSACFYIDLGRRVLARPAGLGGHRRQDVAAQSRPQGRQRAPLPPWSRPLRHQHPAGAGPGAHRRQGVASLRPSRAAGQAGRGRQPEGALVTIDAIACNPRIAGKITGHGADYLLAVKANQPSLRQEVERFFADAPPEAIDRHVDLDKGTMAASRTAGSSSRATSTGIKGQRRFPGEHRFPNIAAVAKIETRTELADRCRHETRYFIASRSMTAKDLADAVRGHWSIENSLHWVLDVTFREDLCSLRLQKGHGAKNMAPRRTLRPQPGASGQGSAIYQAAPKTSRPKPPIPRRYPTAYRPLTRTRCPADPPDCAASTTI